MLQSHLSHFIRKEVPKDEEAYNAQILIRAGFIDKLMAGVYTFLPLGLRVLHHIERIVRDEMNALGAQEVLMPVLHPRENWQQTGRWDSLDVLFKVIARDKKEYALGPTHEEIVVPVAQRAIFSYKDLPMALYQIQTKFRDEARAKSGLLRGREFLMKDLYSFHTDEADLEMYYQRAIVAYKTIFKRLGLDALLVEASGGTFSKFSHEFQVQVASGEDHIVYCTACQFAQNREINEAQDGDACPMCGKPLTVVAASEVGNIFQLKTKYSDPFKLQYTDHAGASHAVIMGCYGIGISRLMGIIAELFHDEKGLLWPASVAPFQAHLLAIVPADENQKKDVLAKARDIYNRLQAEGIEVLYDDREGISAGEKFAESDLIGIPVRLVVSAKTGEQIELKERGSAQSSLVDFSSIKKYCKEYI